MRTITIILTEPYEMQSEQVRAALTKDEFEIFVKKCLTDTPKDDRM